MHRKVKKECQKKEFDARVEKGMAEDARIAKVKKENMEAAKKTVLSPKTQLRNKKIYKT